MIGICICTCKFFVLLDFRTHHSVVEHKGRWYLFYHDCEMSKGVSHLRSVKVEEIWCDKEGAIVTEKPNGVGGEGSGVIGIS